MASEQQEHAEFYEKNIGMKRWGWLPRQLRSGLKELHDRGIVKTSELRQIGSQFVALEPHRKLVIDNVLPQALELYSSRRYRDVVNFLLRHTESKKALDDLLHPPNFEVESSAGTHPGARPRNEDAYYSEPGRKLFAVADGLGGHNKGDEAAWLAVTTLSKEFDPKKPESLLAAVHAAHRAINDRNEEALRKIAAEEKRGVHYSERAKQLARMHTTLTALHVDDNGSAHIAHVGDTRVYQLRNGELSQLTTDHSNPHIQSELTQAVGQREPLQPEHKKVEAHHNDVFLLCSDGVNKHVSDVEIKNALKKYANNEATHRATVGYLIRRANELGGSDNITAVVVKVRRNSR